MVAQGKTLLPNWEVWLKAFPCAASTYGQWGWVNMGLSLVPYPVQAWEQGYKARNGANADVRKKEE